MFLRVVRRIPRDVDGVLWLARKSFVKVRYEKGS